MKRKKIILFGDSVLFGTGASHRNLGCSRVVRGFLPDFDVVIKGKNLSTTRDGLVRLEGEVLTHIGPATVAVLFGNNDCRLKGVDCPEVPLKEYHSNLRMILSRIAGAGKTPVISNLQPIDSELFYAAVPAMKKYIVNIDCSPREWQGRYSLACDELAGTAGVRLINIRAALEKAGRGATALDGLHPNDEGHRMIAEIFARTLKDISRS